MIGVVIIGRNEGERLHRCLTSVTGKGHEIVYVDSGSCDGSAAWAKKNGASVVELDMTLPFTAARARNEGFARLHRLNSKIQLVQFIDGDCELIEGWFEVAATYLGRHELCGVVAGRTIERFPDQSIYNLLCDLEWRTPFGRVASCGGIFMVRKDLFEKAGGFNQKLIGGEEPELCYRLRKLKYEIHRLDYPMTYHDAAMTKFSQWWKRSVRGGFAYAQGYVLYGDGQDKYGFNDLQRIWFWGLIVPGAILSLVIVLGPWLLLLLAVYPLQLARLTINVNKRFNHWHYSLIYSFFNILCKWPQLYGQIKFWTKKKFNKSTTKNSI